VSEGVSPSQRATDTVAPGADLSPQPDSAGGTAADPGQTDGSAEGESGPALDGGPVRLIDAPPADERPVAAADESPTAAKSIDDEAVSDLLPLPDRFTAGFELSFGFNLQRIPGQGEDSDPIVAAGADVGLLAVFDGMGGAGGTVYQTPDGPRTGAYLASRVVRDVVQRRMVALLGGTASLDGPLVALELQQLSLEALNARVAELHAPKSGLRSRLLRALPTTMALAAVQRAEPGGDTWDGLVFWAGDSRVYLFDSSGAHQLTRDDLREHGDAMANVHADSVVSNAISADTPFVINYGAISVDEPSLLLAATDGCFGFFRSPMHFEQMILATLQRSTDVSGWCAAVQQEIAAVTGDDAAMAGLLIDTDLEAFRTRLAGRAAEVDHHWVAPMDELADRIADLETELAQVRTLEEAQTARLWAEYQPEYERRLADSGHRGAP
jgi:serine/threonine protein phosphatase PrpC